MSSNFPDLTTDQSLTGTLPEERHHRRRRPWHKRLYRRLRRQLWPQDRKLGIKIVLIALMIVLSILIGVWVATNDRSSPPAAPTYLAQMFVLLTNG